MTFDCTDWDGDFAVHDPDGKVVSAVLLRADIDKLRPGSPSLKREARPRYGAAAAEVGGGERDVMHRDAHGRSYVTARRHAAPTLAAELDRIRATLDTTIPIAPPSPHPSR